MIPLIMLGLVLAAQPAMSEEIATGSSTPHRPNRPVARYVISIGVNTPIDADTPPLRYADDDAVQLARLLAPHAVRVDLLTLLDEPTQHRFPGAAAEVRLPTHAEVLATLRAVATQIEADRRSHPGVARDLLFAYVGHGGTDADGHGYIKLADGVLSRAELFAELLAASVADTTHVIIDACHAVSLVAGRGAGEAASATDQLFERFLDGHDLEGYPGVGVLAATTSTNETHEWSEIQSGLFSYQLRAALAGAADVNGDGALEYSEVAAFIEAANAEVPEDAKRLAVFAWAPARDRRAPLLDAVPVAGRRRVVLGPAVTGRLVLESETGVRWAELNKPAGATASVWVPRDEVFFLRSPRHELEITAGEGVAVVDVNPSAPRRLAARGAIDRAWRRTMFATPYGYSFYRGFVAGRRNLVPVQAGPIEPGQTDRPDEPRLELGVRYGVAPFVLAKDHLEQSLGAAGTWALTTDLFLAAQLEIAYAALAPLRAKEGWRTALLVGAGYGITPLPWLSLRATAQVGYEAIALGSRLASGDWAAGLGRAALLVRVGLPRVSVEAGPAVSTHFVTVGGSRRRVDRGELQLGLSW